MRVSKGGLWLLVFIGFFVLTQDYLFLRWPVKLTVLGFPAWLWWFIGVHLLFVVAFYYFSRRYWKEPE